MKKTLLGFALLFLFSSFVSAQSTPTWVNNLTKEYPSNDWVAAVGQGSTRAVAEQQAMNNLARIFRTDVASITQASQRFDQIITEAGGKKTVSFDQSQNFSQQVNTTTNIRGLIGVEIDYFQARNGTHYVCARMNRQECTRRYAATVQENTAVINRLINIANGLPLSFDKYAALHYASLIADINDNFQNILEVLDSTAANRRPGYGGANAVKLRVREVAGEITIGIVLVTQENNDAIQIRRAISSFFTDKGFKTNEQGQGLYVFRTNARFEPVAFDNVQSCRYYFNASLEKGRTAVFSFTVDDRANHNRADEARRLAVRRVEEIIKEGSFAEEFDTWLGSLIE